MYALSATDCCLILESVIKTFDTLFALYLKLFTSKRYASEVSMTLL